MNISSIKSLDKSADAVLSVPGSKSYSLRALYISALCEESFDVENLLRSEDTLAMQGCLKGLKIGKSRLDAKESGLTARFLTTLACVFSGTQIIDGAPGLRKRPIGELVTALKTIGADIEYINKEGFLPIRISSSSLLSGKININGATSSQYLSALLLIAPALREGLIINVTGEQTSKPYIDMTLDIMSAFGVSVENYNYQKYVIKPQKYIANHYKIEGDYSSASYFFAIATLTNSKITVSKLNLASKQADAKLLPILEKMGTSVSKNIDSITVQGKSLKPININMNNCPDQAMTIAVLAAFADGKSIISGIKSLRIKETERIQALQNELAKMGILTNSTPDSLCIYGGKPKATTIDTYGDHRLAMAFAVAGTKLNGMQIIAPKVVDKTFPGFWYEMRKITPVNILDKKFDNIVLIGMRGTGKSSVGRIIAKKLSMNFIDTDQYIESSIKLNIKKTVQTKGWEFFRELETEAIKKLSSRTNCVISTGGGAILNEQNVETLRANNLVIMLNADYKVLAKRISRYSKLPALTQHQSIESELAQVWHDRKNKYYEACHLVVDSEKLSQKAVARQIIDKLEL